MKALVVESFEAPPAVTDVGEPVAGAGEVLVRLAASSVNAYDMGVAAGFMREYLPHDLPIAIGTDVAGTVEAVGDDVEGFAPGDRVFGAMGAKARVHDGAFAELANPLAANLAATPDGLADLDAGSVATAGTTAQSAVNAVDPGAGGRVVVIGATGGVGTFAIQLATLAGAHVIASVRPGDEAFVTELGAAETVDYTADLAATIRERYPEGVDAVIDAVNRDPAVFADVAALVRDDGRATSVVGGAGEAARIGGVSVSNTGSDAGYLSSLADHALAGRVRVAIRRTYPLDDAARALQDFATEHTLGKLVIAMG